MSLELITPTERAAQMQFLWMLGATEWGQPFSYSLIEINGSQATVAVPKATESFPLEHELSVALYLPFSLHGNGNGELREFGCLIRQSRSSTSDVYSVHLSSYGLKAALAYQALSSSSCQPLSIAENVVLCRALIKDSLLVKEAILIYLQHLIPYSSRLLGNITKDYPTHCYRLLSSLKESFKEERKLLSGCDELLTAIATNHISLPSIDLKRIRAAFASQTALLYRQIMAPMVQKNKTKTSRASDLMGYLEEIQESESRCYLNYNRLATLLALLHTHALNLDEG